MAWLNQGHAAVSGGHPMMGGNSGPTPGGSAPAAGGYGPMHGQQASAQRPGPYSTSGGGPLPPGPVGCVGGALGGMSSGATAFGASSGGATPGGSLLDLLSPEAEKANLLQRLQLLQKTKLDAKAKWWSFCKVHGEGSFDANTHDSAFLQTFFEAYQLGEVPDEPGCPFSVQPMAGTGGATGPTFGDGGAKGAGWAAAPAGTQAIAEGGGVEKLFVGGLPKTATEDALWTHFSWYGTVTRVDLKYDMDGGFRGFGFVSFQDPQSVLKVVEDKTNSMFQGKWIDCKVATGTSKGCKGEKGSKGDKGAKGGKGKKGDKGCKGGKGPDGWGSSHGGGDWGGSNWGGAGGGSKGSKDGGKGKGPGSSDETKIFVGAMPKTVTPDTVWNFFSQFGAITHVDLKYDETGGFRGFGFVTFASVDALEKAVGNTPNNYLDGKWVDVKPAARGEKGGKGDKNGKGDKGSKGGDKGGKSNKGFKGADNWAGGSPGGGEWAGGDMWGGKGGPGACAWGGWGW